MTKNSKKIRVFIKTLFLETSKTNKTGDHINVVSCSGAALSSRVASNQVFSALQSLTTVFGMGTGGTSAPKVPDISQK